jgi:hypothetical protein
MEAWEDIVSPTVKIPLNFRTEECRAEQRREVKVESIFTPYIKFTDHSIIWQCVDGHPQS